MKLEETVSRIEFPDRHAMDLSWKRWDSIAKPLRSLGHLEKAVVQIAGMTGSPEIDLGKKGLIIMCADNGVVEEGVTQSGQEVTAIVAENFLKEKSCVAIMCRQTGTDIFPVDIGMAVDTEHVEKRKVARGSKNMAKGPAMTREQAIEAIEIGIEKAVELKEQGYRILATGEMGIGNTTTSSAVTAAMLRVSPASVTGRGAGLSGEGLKRKIQTIEQALKVNHPDPGNPLDVLAKVGGFDIAGLCGVFLGAASVRLPVVMDGFISSVAALLAVSIAPGCREYILPSHMSGEPASEMVLKALDMEPFLTCRMCLGEGSGAVALFPLLDLAVSIYKKMSSFEEAQIERYVPFD